MKFRIVAAASGFWLAALVAISLARLPLTAQNASAQPEHDVAHRLKAEGIPNFARVSKNLYRGGQPGLSGLAALTKLGVEIVVDLRGGHSDAERAAVTKLGMQYVSIPSHCPFPRDRPWASFLKVMRDNEGKKVFVHCRLGDDRTGLAVAVYRMADQGWLSQEALNEMELFGFSGIHPMICPGLKGYVKKFPKRLKTHAAFRDLRAPSGTTN